MMRGVKTSKGQQKMKNEVKTSWVKKPKINSSNSLLLPMRGGFFSTPTCHPHSLIFDTVYKFPLELCHRRPCNNPANFDPK